jgi:hypothetical protein
MVIGQCRFELPAEEEIDPRQQDRCHGGSVKREAASVESD